MCRRTVVHRQKQRVDRGRPISRYAGTLLGVLGPYDAVLWSGEEFRVNKSLGSKGREGYATGDLASILGWERGSSRVWYIALFVVDR